MDLGIKGSGDRDRRQPRHRPGDARQFLEEGARVLICGRNAEKLGARARRAGEATGGEIHAIVADMIKHGDIERLVASARRSSAAWTYW